MFGKTNAIIGSTDTLVDGDVLGYGDNTLNWTNVGWADSMIITSGQEESDIVGTGEVGYMILGPDDNHGYIGRAVVGASRVSD